MNQELAVPFRIIWEKWKDPFLAAVKEEGWHDSYERPGQVGVYQGPMLAGPAGLIPLNELNVPSKNFNLWVGHCSFLLDYPTFDRMKVVPGVEVIKPWTPYRFWLGIGRAFEEKTVKRLVLEAAKVPNRRAKIESDDLLRVVTRTAASQYKHWAVFLLENGKITISGSDDIAQVEAQVRERASQSKRIITSWDER